ncbi:MAG: penicillin-binding protein, partial [Prevotella sp.]|nr:penicillin-binding protein [Prevotella sp.]
MPRYSAIAIVMTLIAFIVIGKALYIMTAEHEYWEKVANRVKKDSVSIKPIRGNILSCEGNLMASSLPEFKIFMDFNALRQAGNDSLWEVKLDSICMCLNQIFPEKPASEFKEELEQGRAKQSKHWPIWKHRVDYNTFCEVKNIPVFNM